MVIGPKFHGSIINSSLWTKLHINVFVEFSNGVWSVCLGIFHGVGLVKGTMVIAVVKWSFVDWWLILQQLCLPIVSDNAFILYFLCNVSVLSLYYHFLHNQEFLLCTLTCHIILISIQLNSQIQLLCGCYGK